jgi:hypothetical protein
VARQRGRFGSFEIWRKVVSRLGVSDEVKSFGRRSIGAIRATAVFGCQIGWQESAGPPATS